MAPTAKEKVGDWADAVAERLFPGMDGRQILILYVVIPLAIGSVLDWYRAGYATNYPLAVSLFEWVVNFFTLWIAFDVGSRLVALLMRPRLAPLWLILILGGVVGVVVTRPLRVVVRDVTGSMAPEARPDISFPEGMGWEEFVFAYASVIAMPILIWLVVNLIYAHSLGVPRYGHHAQSVGRADQTDGSDPAEPPEFTKRMTLGPDAEIWALQAEDHYLIPTVIEFDLRVPICAYQST